MATTYVKRGLGVIAPDSPFGSLFERVYPEGASQTFVEGSPLKLASGLAVVWVNPTDADIAAFSLEAGHNTTGESVRVMLALPHIEIEANFLGSAAADNVLAAADLGITRDLAYDANLLGTGEGGWYIADTSSDVAVRITGFLTDNCEADSFNSAPVAGDTNARIRARVEPGKSLWY